jgi:hypothetical protein
MRKHRDDEDEEDDVELLRRSERSNPRLRRFLREDDEDEDIEPPEEELEHILCSIDRHRRQLEVMLHNLNGLLNRHPDLREQYQAFLGNGGVSKEDFERFLHGQLRPRLIPHRRHLRLLVDNLVVRRRKPAPPDDAA